MTAKRFKMTSELPKGWVDIIDIDNNQTLCNIRIEYANHMVNLLNELHEEKEQLLSDKEHLMGCLIRFFGYDDEDIDYNLNRESNREYGKAYYSMKEETEKELEE